MGTGRSFVCTPFTLRPQSMALSLSILRRALFVVSLSVMCASVIILVRECPLCVCVCFGM